MTVLVDGASTRQELAEAVTHLSATVIRLAEQLRKERTASESR